MRHLNRSFLYNVCFMLAFTWCYQSVKAECDTNRDIITSFFENTFFQNDSTYSFGSIIHHVDLSSFLSKDETKAMYERYHKMDSLVSDYIFYSKNDEKRVKFLAMSHAEDIDLDKRKFYLIDNNDCNGLLSAFAKTNYQGYSIPADSYSSDALKNPYSPIYKYSDNLYLFSPEHFTDRQLQWIKLHYLKDSIGDYTLNAPLDSIKELINSSPDAYTSDLCDLDLISPIHLNISEEQAEALRLYRINAPIILEHDEVNNPFYMLIFYKGMWFFCPNWEYDTWGSIFYHIILDDERTPQFYTSDLYSIIGSIDDLSQFNWYTVGNINISPKLYRTLSDYFGLHIISQ